MRLAARRVHQQRHATTTKYLEAPHYLEVDLAEKRTTFLTGGLPFHRRSGPAGRRCGNRERVDDGVGAGLKTRPVRGPAEAGPYAAVILRAG